MSKSDPEDTYIAILDEPDVIRKKMRRAVTDCDNSVRFDPENKPGVSNLMSIMSALSGKGMDEITAEFDGLGLREIQGRRGRLRDRRAGAHSEALRRDQHRQNLSAGSADRRRTARRGHRAQDDAEDPQKDRLRAVQAVIAF